MIVMIVNDNRYLINTDASEHQQEQACRDILRDFPSKCEIEWDRIRAIDF